MPSQLQVKHCTIQTDMESSNLIMWCDAEIWLHFNLIWNTREHYTQPQSSSKTSPQSTEPELNKNTATPRHATPPLDHTWPRLAQAKPLRDTDADAEPTERRPSRAESNRIESKPSSSFQSRRRRRRRSPAAWTSGPATSPPPPSPPPPSASTAQVTHSSSPPTLSSNQPLNPAKTDAAGGS